MSAASPLVILVAYRIEGYRPSGTAVPSAGLPGLSSLAGQPLRLAERIRHQKHPRLGVGKATIPDRAGVIVLIREPFDSSDVRDRSSTVNGGFIETNENADSQGRLGSFPDRTRDSPGRRSLSSPARHRPGVAAR